MIAVGRLGIEKDFGWKDWSVCKNGLSCFKVGTPSLAMVGTNAGTLTGTDGVERGGVLSLGSACWLFLYKDSRGWHYFNARCVQNPGSIPGSSDSVFVTGCANFRAEPALSATVLGCLGNGTNVSIDSAPVYKDGHIWWHLAGRGWMAHDYLVGPKIL
jgi:hypothetical protein